MNNKELILRKAESLFHSYGFSNTSIDRIIRETDVSKSNFYYHFESKEELGLSILDNLIDKYKKDFISPTLLNENLNPDERLKNFLLKIVDYHIELSCHKGCPFGNLATEQSDINERFREKLSKFFEEWKNSIENCIIDGINESYFSIDIDPSSIADLILSQIEGAILLSKTHKSPETLKNSSLQLLNLIKNRETYYE